MFVIDRSCCLQCLLGLNCTIQLFVVYNCTIHLSAAYNICCVQLAQFATCKLVDVGQALARSKEMGSGSMSANLAWYC